MLTESQDNTKHHVVRDKDYVCICVVSFPLPIGLSALSQVGSILMGSSNLNHFSKVLPVNITATLSSHPPLILGINSQHVRL